MEETLMVIVVGFLGLVLGSFAGAQVWRIRARQLKEDKDAKEDYDKKEYRRLKVLLGKKGVDDRSRCLSCGHELAWYDLLPLVSWLSTRGKCRYCKKPIGSYEPLMELGLAALFIVSYLLWPFSLQAATGVAVFVLWLVACVLMAILFVYDKKWMLLPDSINFSLMAVAAVFALVQLYIQDFSLAALLSLVGSIAIMSGIYYALYLYSRGAWIGFGDIKLGLGLGLLLGQWELAFLALFLANLIGTLLVLPALITKKLGRRSEISFGPLLIIGTVITVLVGHAIIDAFFRLTLA